MITQQTQIKLNLPRQLKDYITSRASRFGMPVASYVRYLIIKDVEDMEYSVYKASDRVEKLAEEAMKKKDKSVAVKDIDKFFDSL